MIVQSGVVRGLVEGTTTVGGRNARKLLHSWA
jgi:hypothetical protein